MSEFIFRPNLSIHISFVHSYKQGHEFSILAWFTPYLYFKYSIWQNHFFSICNGVLYFLSLLVLVVLVERGINFVCCSTRCFVAYDSWYRIYITPGHQSPTEPSPPPNLHQADGIRAPVNSSIITPGHLDQRTS